MERVHYQQEQMLPELKDLVEKGLFTQNEIRQIVKQRTAFESALVRRVAKKADFIRYVSYEMDLESLRRKRVKRLDLPKAAPTVSDYAFVRRQFHIFERALKRFKSDVGLWVQYIQLAKREGAKALVGRVTARALQLHPSLPTFYILAASHELDNLAPSAARALLQRGIRANPDSVEMWREYVKMELGFVESMRRRWEVLGIKVGEEDAKGKQKEEAQPGTDPSPEVDVTAGEGDKMDVEEENVDETGSEARKQIMEGAIVKSVITNAAQALPKIELFVALQAVISDFPSPPALQQTLLDEVFDALGQTLPRDPKGMELRARRHLKGLPSSVGFVDGLKKANEEMLAVIGDGGEDPLLEAYASFVEEWCGKAEDDHLRMYLISSLQGLIQKQPRSEGLLSAHIRVLTQAGHPPAKLRTLAEKYTRKAPSSSRVWLARLAVENTSDVWTEARKRVRGSEEEVVRVWTWGGSVSEELLRESMQTPAVHEALLVQYIAGVVAPGPPDNGAQSDQVAWCHSVRHMARYLTTARVWEVLWTSLDTTDAEARQLVYGLWAERDCLGAGLGYARWLVSAGEGARAAEIIVQTRRRLPETLSGELDTQWAGSVE